MYQLCNSSDSIATNWSVVCNVFVLYVAWSWLYVVGVLHCTLTFCSLKLFCQTENCERLFPECTSSIYITDSEKGQSEAENEGQTIQWSSKGGKEKQRPTNFKQTWLNPLKSWGEIIIQVMIKY